MRSLVSIVEDVCFPPICAGCRKRGAWCCDRCRALAQPVPRPICHRCGQPTPEPLFTCTNCDAWPGGIGAVRAAFVFGGVVREQVHRFKYQGEFARAPYLAMLMFERIVDREFVDHSSWDVVAFVPLHRAKRRRRGFDQAELLARHLAERLDLPVERRLKRVRNTPSQVGRGEADRRTNMKDAFDWTGDPLSGERILLIDDVITTGATLVAAAEPLLRWGASRVDGFALAREVLG